MAKLTTRVHILAKELGVKSKAIVEKCQAEGLDVKNHMSTISIGLAETIREWFTDSDQHTAVETSDKVDLDKVRIEVKTKEAEESQDSEVVEESQEIEEAEDKQAIEEKREKPQEKIPVLKRPEPIPAPAAPPEMVKHDVPTDVKPAGPQLVVPKPAKLNGPKVVRVEKPEEIRKPKPKQRPAKSKPRFDQGATESLTESMPVSLVVDKGGKKSKKRGGKKKEDEDQLNASGSKKYRGRDMEERQERLAAARGETLRLRPSRKIGAKKSGQKRQQAEDVRRERPEKASVTEPITVKSLSAALAVKSGDIIAKLIQQGVMATANQVISTDMAELVSLEFGTELVVERKQRIEEDIEQEFAARERNNLSKRHPVVTMLGHVDHGKTSLLDRIRSASVASGEAGGITQHTSAYQVNYKGTKVTFLDTPGHAAFTAMRARGANMTDIVILVVAADDGVMPQTAEAIRHAQAAEVPIVVALNKIDIPGVDINKIYGQLAEHDLVPTEWGGDTEVIKTSAHTGEGIDDLIEHIDILAELHDFKADSTIPAMGWVVEAKMTTTQGVVATILLKEGCLNKGDVIFAGNGFGKIRTMKDSFGKSLKKANSSMPVEITGLNGVPSAGDKFYSLNDLNRAKAAAEENQQINREASLAQRQKITLDNLFSQIEAGNVKELNLIVRADVQGSVDVLIKYLTDLSTDEIKVKILHAAVGGITEGDVVLAEASSAIVIGFNVVPEDQVKSLADSKGVDIRLYNVIYRITEDLKDAMVGMLEPDEEERVLGKLVVRNTFKVSGVGTVAGCYVTNGHITKNAKVRLIRNNIVVKDNCTIDSLKHFKDDVKEVKSGFECGLKIAGFDDIKIDDAFEAYEIVEVARKL